MTTIGSPIDNIYSDLGINKPRDDSEGIGQTQLGQADFLALLTTQLANQDPLSPTDSKEFISQMTQFSSLDSLQRLVNKFDDLAVSLTSNQALQASSLVGRHVLIPSSLGVLQDEGGISGQLNLPSRVENLRFEVHSSSGEVVRRVVVGSAEAGDMEFLWDGRDEAGDPLSPGVYEIFAYGNIDGKTEQLATSIRSQVQSVSLEASGAGIFLNLVGLGQIDFKDVKEVG